MSFKYGISCKTIAKMVLREFCLFPVQKITPKAKPSEIL
jgi:hypothetical protein